MKYFYLILSIYIMALSIMPCHDQEDLSANQSTSEITQKTDEHAGDCQDESCPPLCHCSCCGTTFVIIANAQLSFSVKEILPVNFLPAVQKPTRVSSSIWQPPRLA